jgi:hypothetical protein
LEEACQLPRAKELWTKQDRWINERKDEIASAIKQFENHVNRNNSDQQLLRGQTTLLASLVFEQQTHICDLNDRYLRLLEEKRQLAQVNDTKIHNDVDTIIDTMKTLQEALNQRHDTVTKLLEPIDMSKIMSTNYGQAKNSLIRDFYSKRAIRDAKWSITTSIVVYASTNVETNLRCHR